jgi:stalled ribosome rescue protein Dom34
LGEKPDLAYYKDKDVRKALQYGAVDLLILSREFDKKTAKELSELAENIGARVEIVSTETPEGEQFNNLSGVGAMLRFKIQ